MDTCGCVVDVGFESEDPTQLHGILEKYVHICSQHLHLHPFAKLEHRDDTAYQEARKENNKKNIVLAEILTSNLLPQSIVNVKHNYDRKTRTLLPPTVTLHEEIIYNYYFTEKDRQFIFSLEGIDKNGKVLNIDNNIKASITNHLNKKLGTSNHQIVDILHEDLHPEYKRALRQRSFDVGFAKQFFERN